MQQNVLMFDLDGTLLPFDFEPFMAGYFAKLSPKVTEWLNPISLAANLWAATQAMVENEDVNMTNLDKFKQSFLTVSGLTEEQIWPTFDAFYANEFTELHSLTKPTPIAREICRTAIDKGYRLVLATNPIFPSVAIRERMAWAGIADISFTLVTDMETMHFCKPNPKYFIEVLDRIDAFPAECVMVGNDVQEDGVAGKLGMDTFLVTDHLIDRGLGHLEFTHTGTLVDVLKYVQELPAIL